MGSESTPWPRRPVAADRSPLKPPAFPFPCSATLGQIDRTEHPCRQLNPSLGSLVHWLDRLEQLATELHSAASAVPDHERRDHRQLIDPTFVEPEDSERRKWRIGTKSSDVRVSETGY